MTTAGAMRKMDLIKNNEGLTVKRINATPRQSAIIRFLQMIQVNTAYQFQDTPCWDWQGYMQANGSGQFKVEAVRKRVRKIGPHRFAYEFFIGATSANPAHLCGRNVCCSPLHLGLKPLEELRDSPECILSDVK